MNILKFEIKNNFKSFCIWSLSLVIIYVILMRGLYPVFSDSMSQVQQVYANFPPGFAAAFGLNISFIFSYGGYYGFAFGYITLVGAIMAVSLSIASFSREKRTKCQDFIFTKPVKREQVFLYKLLANLILLLLTNVLFIVVGMFLFMRQNVSDTDTAKYFMALLAVFFTQVVFLCIGILLAIFLKKIRSVSGIATAIGFAAFILSALVNIIGEDWLKLIAPLKYFDPYPLLRTGSFEGKYVIMAILVSIACVVASFIHYYKKDVHAV